MRRGIVFIVVLSAALCWSPGGSAEDRPTEISVGYSQQWPTPSLFSREKGIFDSALGLKVNWIPFASGNEMSAAMASGEVQIAYSLGHVPFLVGVSSGLDLTMIGIALGYSENDNCILSGGAGINGGNASLLEGRKVAVQTGSITHFKLLKVLSHLKVDFSRVQIVAAADGDAAAEALRRGEVVMACASGGALQAMTDLGKPLMTGAEQEAIGLKVFDTVSVSTGFMLQQPEIVQAFMDVIEASNEQWHLNPDPMRAAIARAANPNQDGFDGTIDEFDFPGAAQQKTDAWMGGLVPAYSKEIADFFVEQGRLDKTLESYERFITTRFLR